MSEDIIPSTEDGRKSWAENLILKFPPQSAALGFSNAETAAFINDLTMLIYVINAAQSASAEAKALTAYKKQMLDGAPDNTENPSPPAFSPPAAPTNLVPPGIISRLRAVFQRAKTAPAYTDAVGEQLQIVFKSADFSLTDAKPTFKATAAVGKITLDWVKSKFDGVIVESQRGTETTFILLDKDFKSPFEDFRPPLVAGQPEKRHYRMIYLLDDESVGNYSDEAVITTII